MADFVGLLKKTIDAQSNMTPQLRHRIYERAKAAVERKLSEKPLAQQVVNEQRAILQHAIDEVEAYYLAQEGMNELLDFAFDEGDSLDSINEPAHSPHFSDKPTSLPEHNLSSEPTALPNIPDEIDSHHHENSNFVGNAALANSSQNKAMAPIGHQDTNSEHRFGIVREEASSSEPFVLPIRDQHRIGGHYNEGAVAPYIGEDYDANKQSRAEERAQREAEEKARLEAIELEREEERRIATEQALKEAEEKARLEAIELEREEERRIATEQALREAEEKARLEAIELEREEERRIAAEQAQKEAEEKALKEAQDREREEEEQYRLAQERMRIAEQARLEAEALEKSEEEARIAAEAKAQENEAARLEAIDHASRAEEAKLEAQAEAKEEELAKQASEQHFDAKEKAALEIDARLSIEGARTIIPRKNENSNFDPTSYRAFDGNLDIAAERDIAGSRKEKPLTASPEIMPMPPLGRASKANEVGNNSNEAIRDSAAEDLSAQINNLSAAKGADTNKKSGDNFDLVSDIFSQAARRDQKSARSHVGMIIVIIIIVLAALGAGIYLLFPTEKVAQPATPATDVSANHEAQDPATPPATAEQNDATAPTDTTNNKPNEMTAEPANSTDDATAVTPDADKSTERLMPDGREVVVGPSQQGTDNGSEGTSSTQATSIVQRSANATFFERETSVLPANASRGIVEWKLIRTKGKDNGPDELAIRGEILIPERDLTARITVRRNDDPSIRADFLMDLSFIVPENFDGGSVADIGRVRFKAAENSTGQELAGMLPVKVDTNFFIIAVSSNASSSNRNMNLNVMRQFRWISIPVIYENGRVAEFSIDKGDYGDNIFKQVIDDWLSQNRWAQNSGSPNIIAPLATNPAPAVVNPAPAAPSTSNTAPVENATQNTAPASSTAPSSVAPSNAVPSNVVPSNVVPLPSNVPVPTTPAIVPVPRSVPVPSAPPAQ